MTKTTPKPPQTHLLLAEVLIWALQAEQTEGQLLGKLIQEMLGLFGHGQLRAEVGMFDFIPVSLEQGLSSLPVVF